MSKGLVSWCYFYKFAWQWPLKFKESVLPVRIEILGRYCHFLVHTPLEQVITNFVRNEGPSFLLFTSQFIALDTQVFIVFEHSICVFSSPELKAQWSVSDHLSSVVCLSARLSVRPSVYLSVSVCLYVCQLLTFSSSSPEPLGQFRPNLAQCIPRWRGFKFVQMKGHTLS